MASVFLGVNQKGYNVANSGDSIYGQAGEESVNILEGVTGITVDQNMDQVSLAGNVSDFTFQQQGNRLLVYKGGILSVTMTVQVDNEGTVIGFDDGIYNAEFGAGSVIELGGTAVPDDFPGGVVPGDDPPEVITVGIDTGSLESPVTFDAADGAYNFQDNAAVAGNVKINNFSSDDIISFSNADVNDYSFQSENTDVTLSYNYNDSGIINIIELIGVVSSADLVFDQDSFVAAIGFDPFAV
jgi:hypothetical protein